jgi:hypothetical protein
LVFSELIVAFDQYYRNSKLLILYKFIAIIIIEYYLPMRAAIKIIELFLLFLINISIYFFILYSFNQNKKDYFTNIR